MGIDKQQSLQLVARYIALQRYLAQQSQQNQTETSSNDNETLIVNASFSIEDEFEKNLKQYIFEREYYTNATLEIGTHFGRTYVVLGALAVFLNLIILIILMRHRRQVLRNVFYILIFNFALIDCMKGVCLITYAMRMIKSPGETTNLKFDQYMTLIFRFCNMATILNLLMITLNEFIFIKFPLRYHRYINRKSAMCCILLNWVICMIFTIASTFAKGSGDRVFVPTNYTTAIIRNLEENNIPTNNTTISTLEENNISLSLSRNLHASNGGIKRGDLNAEMEVHYIFAFTLTAICVICLLVVIVCYTLFFRVIREIRMYDARLFNDANRRMSEMSICSDSTLSSGGLIDERRIKRQVLKRYKYVLVIGTVICIYMLYLLTYSTIQIFQYIQLSRDKSQTSSMTTTERWQSYMKSYTVRWVLQILVGLHSVFQPLCYFRMKEFRQFINKAIGKPCRRRKADNAYHHKDILSSFFDSAAHLPSMMVRKSSTPNMQPINQQQQEPWYSRLWRNSNDFSISSRRNSYFYDTTARRISNESAYHINGNIIVKPNQQSSGTQL